MGETSNVALLKAIVKKYAKRVYNILYYNRNISTVMYEKLALSIDSLKMLVISMEWYYKKYSVEHSLDLYREFDEGLVTIIQQLKTMIVDFDKGRIDNKKIIKLNEYLDIISSSIQNINNMIIKKMIKAYE